MGAERECDSGESLRGPSAIDLPEDKALPAGSALASVFTKSDQDSARGVAKRDGAIDRLTAEVAALNAKRPAEITGLDGRLSAEVAALKTKLTAEVFARNSRMVKLDGDVALPKWIVGFTLAMVVTLLFRSYTH